MCVCVSKIFRFTCTHLTGYFLAIIKYNLTTVFAELFFKVSHYTLLISSPSLRLQSCVLFLFLLPFFASAALYFYLWIPDSAPSILAAGVKAAPVLSLVFMVLSYNGGRSLLGVAGGLVMSAGGDICLIWPHLFLLGK